MLWNLMFEGYAHLKGFLKKLLGLCVWKGMVVFTKMIVYDNLEIG
jgi:hypothetical protein